MKVVDLEPREAESASEQRRIKRERRAQRRAERRADIAQLLPHLLTTGNLAAGFYAISLVAQGNPDRAALAILFAGLFDFFDGRVARRVGSSSRFGVEYDSIADTVSFGVAPAILAFHVGELHELGWSGWVLAFMYMVCAALRLARFNVSSGRYRGRFEGLPSPLAAFMVLSTVWFAAFLHEQGLEFDIPPILNGLGVAALGLLMVSPIPYRSGKGFRLRDSNRNVMFVVIAFAAILVKPAITLFVICLSYVALGPIEMWWRRRTGGSLEEVDREAPPEGAGE